MPRLLLLRHSKAAWAQPGMTDFDRPLEPRGRDHARRLGERMKALGLVPDLVLCSTAVRARQTWDGVAETLAPSGHRAEHLDELYTADAVGYLEIVRSHAAAAEAAIVVGHNPMMEELAIELAGSGDDKARAVLANGFPTSGLAVLEFSVPLSQAAPRVGTLAAFLTRKDERGAWA